MKVMESSKDVDLKMFKNIRCKILVLISWCFINYGNTVPIDYCLHPLDKSDCGIEPTPVFSYYKPGSRCEIEMWRGCPTFNKFPNEALCSHHCIGKLFGRIDDDQSDSMTMMMLEEEEGQGPFVIDECRVPMNESDCGVKEQFKYTFIDNLCIRIEWKGCESNNIFDDEESCIKACNPKATEDLKNQLEDLPIDDVKAIIHILDDALTEKTPKVQQLKLKMHTESEIVENTTEINTTVKPVTETTVAATITETTIVEMTTIAEPVATNEVVETTEIVETITEDATTTANTTVAVTTSETTTQATTETITTTEASTTTTTTTPTTTTEGSAEEVVLT